MHAEKTYKLLKKEIKALTTVFETAMYGKLSTDITLIYNLEGLSKSIENIGKRIILLKDLH